LTDHKKIK